ncbi:hypothetical protein PMIT1313_02368 [Prochlorococcus marinus str. MIT 1313]|nr:hypothetical protein PMIT1313_02368 [Prochlorococcus marinus str. MIT 1313]
MTGVVVKIRIFGLNAALALKQAEWKSMQNNFQLKVLELNSIMDSKQ